jgi:lipoprotein-anchoring transpeptidase ErfK/SrfK
MTLFSPPTRSDSHFFRTRIAWLLLLGLMLLFQSCTSVPEISALMDQGGTSGRQIVVSLSQQKAYLYYYGKLVATSPISSGREGKSTPVGRFRVIQKSPNHRSSLYGNYVRDGRVVVENVDVRKGGRPPGSRFEGVPMPYFLRFTGAYGLHAGRVPGYPASSGCVRLPPRHAKRFFNAVQIGTPVIVQR